MTDSAGSGQLISVHPDDINLLFELDKPSYCDLKVTNNTEHYVAYKVKTTSPKKYLVRPNIGVIESWGSCFVRVTLQAQSEYPPNMQCKDKFLLQSLIVPPNTKVDDLSPDTFTKNSGNALEDCKLKVVYTVPGFGKSEDEEALRTDTQRPYNNSDVQRLKDERDAATQQTQQLQQELELLERRRKWKSKQGFSFKFALMVGIIGIMFGFLLNLTLSSPSSE